MGDPGAAGARIRKRLPGLTPPEGKLAADILALNDISLSVSLREIAERSGVSEAMVVKVAKKLGLSGFRGFGPGLVGCYGSDTAALHGEISVADSTAQIVPKVFRPAMQALTAAADRNLTRTLRAVRSKPGT